MLSTSSSALVSMASQLSEAEERERAFSGRGRWNQVRSLAEAKNIMNFLFNLAASSRCQLRDKEVDCREKDSEIGDLKEKVVNLVRQSALQKAEIKRQETLMKLALERQSTKVKEASQTSATNNIEGHIYDLRSKGYRNSIAFNSGFSGMEVLEDMDTSDDDQSDYLDPTNDHDTDWELDPINEEDTDWERTKERKRRNKKRNFKTGDHVETSIGSEQPSTVTSNELGCCSCSKSSFCKTSRCECRARGGSCGLLCSCEPTKCSNREEPSAKDTVQPDFNEPAGNMSESDETERNHDLASHGATLLRTALSEKPINPNDGGTVRKPLSDIGNSLSGAPKPNNNRKKWRKSVIQLVPAPTLPASQAQNAEIPVSMQQNNSGEVDIPLKLPRAMRSTLTNNNQLKERNSGQSNELVNEDVCMSPNQEARKRNGKENKGL